MRLKKAPHLPSATGRGSVPSAFPEHCQQCMCVYVCGGGLFVFGITERKVKEKKHIISGVCVDIVQEQLYTI